jgi:hypothetical protein|tara:strand:- start:9 stop:752 length:744 start_codon:yes stop_codon:yes gene_type:complete
MTGKKIKVALCLSGEPRNSMFSFPYIYESLVKLGHMYEVDIYIHSWKDFRALPLYNPKKYSIDWVEGGELLKEKYLYLRSLTNHSKTQKLLDQLYEFSFNSTPLKNSFLMYLSMLRCFNLINTSYDIYIRGRFDLYFNSPFNIRFILESIKENKYDIFVPPTSDYKTSLLFNDQFAICNLKAAKHYFNLYNNIPNLIEQSNSLNTHYWLKEHLIKGDLNIKSSICPELDLVRSSKVITIYNTPYYEH